MKRTKQQVVEEDKQIVKSAKIETIRRKKKELQELQEKEQNLLRHPSEDIKEFLESKHEVPWRISVSTKEPFSFGELPNSSLYLTFCSLNLKDKSNEVVAPKSISQRQLEKEKLKEIYLKKEKEGEDLKQIGCVLQVCVQDDEKRRKFILANLSFPHQTEFKLHHRFSEEEVSKLTFELKGRPNLMKEECESVDLQGFIVFNEKATFEDKAKTLFRMKRNYRTHIIDELKKTKYDDENAPWIKSKKEKFEKEKQKKEEEEEEENQLIDDHTEPKQFVRDGVEIHNLFTTHGRRAQKGDKVSIYYKGRLDPDHVKTFDRSTRKNPYVFRLGSKKVIKGINIGVEGMTTMAIRSLVIPPEQGFGEDGIPEVVPPNSTLYYDIQVLEIIPKKKYDAELLQKNKEKQKKENTKKAKKSTKEITKDMVDTKKKKKK
ncbi:hypothetical protein ABK040_006675 [Willaertia magna]